MQFNMSGSILFLPPYTRGEKKPFWFELESNPGPLASQVTTLTTRPWLLGQPIKIIISKADHKTWNIGRWFRFETSVTGTGTETETWDHRELQKARDGSEASDFFPGKSRKLPEKNSSPQKKLPKQKQTKQIDRNVEVRRIKFFCSTSLPLASTRWVRLT